MNVYIPSTTSMSTLTTLALTMATTSRPVITSDKPGVYVKQNSKFLTVIQSYADKTEKVAWYDGFGNIHLAKTTGTYKALAKQSIKISVDELDLFADMLETSNKDDSNLHNVVSTGKNWKKQDVRLVFKRGGETNNQVFLVREYADEVEESDVNTEDEEDDPLPLTQPPILVDKREWKEEWVKFYMSGNDNYTHFASKLRQMSSKVREYKKLLEYFENQQREREVADELLKKQPNEPPPLVEPPTLINSDDDDNFETSVNNSRKRKVSNKSGETKKKRLPKNQFLDDQVLSNSDLHALSVLYTYVCDTKLLPKECILFYSLEMSDTLSKLYKIENYNYIRKLYQRYTEEEFDRLMDEIDKKTELN